MLVNIGSDIEMEVDADALPAVAIGHVVYVGLRNILMDAHASVTEKTNPDFSERQAVKRAVAEKKLAALLAGDIRVAGTRTRTGDPILRRAIKIAMEHIEKSVTDATARRNAAIAKVKKNGAYLTIAESQLKQEAELAALVGEVPESEADLDETETEELAA